MRFLGRLSDLLRTGDTRSLELVVGLIALVFGGQLGATLLGILPSSALVQALSEPVAWLLVGLFAGGGITKVLGAVLDQKLLRITASLSLSGVWLYLGYLSLVLGAAFSLLLFVVFALQSGWIYIRLSIIRKRTSA